MGMQTKIQPATRAAKGQMNAQPSNTKARATAYAVRFMLWLFAAITFSDFAPQGTDPLRSAKFSLAPGVSGEHIASKVASPELSGISAASCDPVSEPELPGCDPALDVDALTGFHRLMPRAGPSSCTQTASSQCLDGQALAAFNSRAPPAIG